MTTPLCPSCAEEAGRWLDTTPQQFPALATAVQAHAAADLTARGMAERRRGRYEKWRGTVRFQRSLIVRHCRSQGHAASASATAGQP